MNEFDKDILIIGQGVAGTCLGWAASQKKLTFDIYDDHSGRNTSAVSSGIINPLTGRKFVKSWKIDEFIPVAKNLYSHIGEELGVDIIDDKKLWRHIPDTLTENIWNSRLSDERYSNLIDDDSDTALTQLFFDSNIFKCIKSSFRINCKALIQNSRSHWLEHGQFLPSKVNFEELRIKTECIIYRGKKYKYCIICIGHHGVHFGPYQSRDYRPVKGEILIVEIKDFQQNAMVKFDKFMIPLGNDLYWLGSNYQFDYEHENPDKSQLSGSIEFLSSKIRRPYKIVDHLCGIRPATRFRRPLIGSHPELKRAYLFNGLGTKGISMAPYFSKRIVDAIQGGYEFRTDAFSRSFSVG